MLLSNPDKVETGVFLSIMGDEEFDRTIDAMKDAEQQVLLNIASTLVDQMESSTAGSLGGLCLVRLDELDRMYPEVTGETLPEYDTEERAGRPSGCTYDAETLQAQWEAKICAAVDMMIETVTEGNESDENGQCGLWDAAQLIVPHLDTVNCAIIDELCLTREEELNAEDEDYTPNAADARGEPGPLDKEPETDLDYFEIAKEIRKRAAAYNSAVLKAEIDAGIKVKVKILAGHTGMIDLSGTDIKMKMSL